MTYKHKKFKQSQHELNQLRNALGKDEDASYFYQAVVDSIVKEIRSLVNFDKPLTTSKCTRELT